MYHAPSVGDLNGKRKHSRHNILDTLSHEFRTPLTCIHGYLDLILEEGPDQLSVEELSDFLWRVRRGSDRLRRLVDDFIFLVMLETGEAATAFRLEWRVKWAVEALLRLSCLS